MTCGHDDSTINIVLVLLFILLLLLYYLGVLSGGLFVSEFNECPVKIWLFIVDHHSFPLESRTVALHFACLASF